MFKIEHNVTTKEIKEIKLSAVEVEQLEKQYAEAKANNDKLKAEAEAKEAQRQAILDRLGLTAEELQVLLG